MACSTCAIYIEPLLFPEHKAILLVPREIIAALINVRSFPTLLRRKSFRFRWVCVCSTCDKHTHNFTSDDVLPRLRREIVPLSLLSLRILERKRGRLNIQTTGYTCLIHPYVTIARQSHVQCGQFVCTPQAVGNGTTDAVDTEIPDTVA